MNELMNYVSQNGSLNSRAATHEYANDTVMDENVLESS